MRPSSLKRCSTLAPASRSGGVDLAIGRPSGSDRRSCGRLDIRSPPLEFTPISPVGNERRPLTVLNFHGTEIVGR
ncbi:Hypothetical protein NTJ_07257 [Nesidiocoris tenuis]|uniref:Uncharacterized protein n=1 Tax=Nesidiocoris tenuis TaxID=355587 RepID=A0ABN7AR85_9HEMI|nr:Hypothetical protein NTJ_07257 [Nesidiocoris tenuis]